VHPRHFMFQSTRLREARHDN